jgi:HAD superfamily hydrolase (TIGR01509 family)
VSFDLVIFDCDGVLVDSEIISCRAHAEALTRHGYPISQAEVAERFLGRSLRDATDEIEAELGRSLPAEFKPQLHAELQRYFAEMLQPVPHVGAALAAIRQPVCVASSGSQQKISSNLRTVNLFDRFAPHLFSAVEVTNGKPAPDLFLYAAARMSAEPGRCLVIEDSVPGVVGAVAAGMTAFGFSGGSHCGRDHGETLRAAGAAAVFDDMRQLPDMIEEFCQIPA